MVLKMGVASSTRKLYPRAYKYGIKTQDFFQTQILPNAQSLFDKWNLSHPSALDLFQLFCCIDTSHDGRINLHEFHRFFGVKKRLITERLWLTCLIRNGICINSDTARSTTLVESENDDECNATLSFHDFVSAICSICSHTSTSQSDASRWAQFAFEIFDIDEVHFLSLPECDALIRMVHDGCSKKVKRECIAIITSEIEGSREIKEGNLIENEEAQSHKMSETDPNAENEEFRISLKRFIHLAEEQPRLVQPLLDIQQKIRRKTLGETFWRETAIQK
jgi:Ca2+-binding EF-hand superfamily protein